VRLLVFGGSFDPPHRGHAALLASAARHISPDLILIIPAYQAPLKSLPGASAEERLAMVRLGLLPSLPPPWRRRTRIETLEVRSRRRVYTVDTLRRLVALHPKAELHFALGSDEAAAFDSWKDQRQLKALCFWWVAPRPGTRGRPPAFFKRLSGPMPEISSTRLRRAIALGEEVSAWVGTAVASYIERRGLYGRALLRELRTLLPPERLRHTLAVARLAERLAERWGLDPQKARWAGLLHDLGRSIPVGRMAKEARQRRLSVPGSKAIARHQPLLFHAYLSADLARRRSGLRDPQILAAIRDHTLGRSGMGPLGRLLYVADACSEDRAYPGAASLRRLAFQDLTEAFRACVRAKTQHAFSLGSWIHPLTISLWNSLQEPSASSGP